MAKRGRKPTNPPHLTRERWRQLLFAVQNAIYRCHLPTNAQYPDYGGRGITVHEPWRVDRMAFRVYIGGLPGADDPTLSLDRIDNSRGYEPGNLRWATWDEQAANRRPHPREGCGLEAARERWPLGSLPTGLVVVGHRWAPGEGRLRPEVQVRCPCGLEWWTPEQPLRRGLKSCRPCFLKKLAEVGRANRGRPPAAKGEKRQRALDTAPPPS